MIGAAKGRQGSAPAAGGGVPQFDAAGGKSGGSGTSLTGAITVASNSDRCLYVFVYCYLIGGPPGVPSSVTYNGVGMTLVGAQDLPNATTPIEKWSVYRLINPDSGTNDVVVTVATQTVIEFHSLSYYDVHQTTPESGFVTQGVTGTNPSVTVTSAVGELVVGGMTVYNKTLTIGTGQTERIYIIGGSSTETIMASEEDGAASVTHDYTISASGQNAVAAWSLKPV